MKTKDFISITPTTNSGFIIEVPTSHFYSGTYVYSDHEGLFKKLALVLNEWRPNDRQISSISLYYKKEGDDDAV